MTMRNEPKTHREISELLPWYINKTLSPDESKKVEAHLAGCAECRNDTEALKALETSVVASNEQAPRPSTNLAARVMDRVEAYERERTRSADQRGWTLRSWFTQPSLALAELAAIVLLAAAVAIYVGRASRFESLAGSEGRRADAALAALAEQEKRYQTLAQNCPDTRRNIVTVNVVFSPAASEKEIRDLLSKINASITQGPSPLGVYIIAIPVSEGSDRRQVQDQTVRELRARPLVVAFAEGKLE